MTLSTPWSQRLLALAVLTSWLVPAANAQITVLREDFEDDAVAYTTSVTEFSDGFGDFFTRTDGSTIASNYEVTGFGGTSYFAAQDIDGEVDSPTQSIFFSNLNIEGLENLSLSFSLAEDDDGENQDWDEPDYLRVYASVFDTQNTTRHAGAETLIFAVESDPGTGETPLLFNTEPRVDTDLDGWGDGTAITSEFAAFVASIPGTGDRLNLRIEISLNAGDEDIAIDDVVVIGQETERVVACAPGTGMGFFVIPGDIDYGFDTDGNGPVGEQVTIANLGASIVSIEGCTVAAFDPLTEQVVFAEPPLGAQTINPRTGLRRSTGAPWPANVIPDGPGALVLVDGAVSVGMSVADVLPNLVAGLVYQDEDTILFNYRSGAVNTSTDDFLAALAALSQSVAGEDEAAGIDLDVAAAPNPFRGRTTVSFGVAEAADVRVAVYDALGREVALLAEAPYGAGRHELAFESADLPAGVYVIRAVVGADARTARVTLAR